MNTQPPKAVVAVAFVIGMISQAYGSDRYRLQTKQPYEIVRSIQATQDGLAHGIGSPKTTLQPILEHAAEKFLAAEESVWRDPKNAEAAIIFTLSGGRLQVIKKIIDSGTSPEPDLELMRAALAYVEGNESQARSLFSKIDAKAFPSVIAGHIAVVQAALITKESPSEAIRLFDLARILSPGTLLEEAALRRELILAERIDDINRFASLASEYIWRFPASAYFKNFHDRFLESVTRFGLDLKPTQTVIFEDLLAHVEALGQIGLYLQIAEKTLVEGKLEITRFAAGKIRQLAVANEGDNARAQLYEAAADVLAGKLEEGNKEIDQVNMRLLTNRDLALRMAVKSLSKQIEDESTGEQGPVSPDLSGRDSYLPLSTRNEFSSSTIEIAQQKLEQAEMVLSEAMHEQHLR